MGMQSSRDTGNGSNPITETATAQDVDLSSFKLSIIKTNTSSELTIGNRKMIVLDAPENKFEYADEGGNVHRIHQLFFSSTISDDEKREALSKILTMLNQLNFFVMQNKAGKSFNTRYVVITSLMCDRV